MMRRFCAWLVWLAFALSWQTAGAAVYKCGDAAGRQIYQDQPCAGQTAVRAAPVSVSGRPLLWKATSNGSTVYLFGSIHVGRADMYPLDAPVMRAFDGAKRLAVEADVGRVDMATAQRLAMAGTYPPGQSLRDHISESTWRQLQKASAQLGIPVELLDRQEPWVVALSLLPAMLQRFGYDAQYGVDMHLLERARSAGKTIHELESLEYQLGLFDDMSDAQQEAMLKETLDEFEKGPAFFDAMLKAWREGDAATLAGFFSEMNGTDAGRASYEALIGERNRGMARKIEELARAGGPLFVVVGVGHLVGDASVVDLMRARGWQVQRM